MTYPNVSALKELLHYERETGELTWLERPSDPAWSRRFAGKPALAYVDPTNGYRKGRLAHRTTYAHRVAFALMTGRWPRGQVDHINGDRTDNRWSNLRECSKAENNRNCRGFSKWGYKGVSRCRVKWQAYIKLAGKKVHLGSFETIEDAAHAYDAAATKHFGDFARLNFPNAEKPRAA